MRFASQATPQASGTTPAASGAIQFGLGVAFGEEDRTRAGDHHQAAERREARRFRDQPANAGLRRRVRIRVAGKVGAGEHAHRIPDRCRPDPEHAEHQPVLLQIAEDLARLPDVEHEHHAGKQREQRIDIEPGVAQHLDRAPDQPLRKRVVPCRRRGGLGGGAALDHLRAAQRFDLLEFHRSLPAQFGVRVTILFLRTCERIVTLTPN